MTSLPPVPTIPQTAIGEAMISLQPMPTTLQTAIRVAMTASPLKWTPLGDQKISLLAEFVILPMMTTDNVLLPIGTSLLQAWTMHLMTVGNQTISGDSTTSLLPKLILPLKLPKLILKCQNPEERGGGRSLTKTPTPLSLAVGNMMTSRASNPMLHPSNLIRTASITVRGPTSLSTLSQKTLRALVQADKTFPLIGMLPSLHCFPKICN